MNKQRKVLITITYSEMGTIVDTKAEEVAQPEQLRTREAELQGQRVRDQEEESEAAGQL
jgi:hypothetical protein